MTNDMLFASGCDKAGKGGLGSNLGFEKMKPTALSLSLSQYQFPSAISGSSLTQVPEDHEPI